MEYIWTAFFGGFNKRDEPFWIDQINLDYKDKEIPRNCRHVKLCFLKIFKNIENIDEKTL